MATAAFGVAFFGAFGRLELGRMALVKEHHDGYRIVNVFLDLGWVR